MLPLVRTSLLSPQHNAKVMACDEKKTVDRELLQFESQ